MSLFQCTY